VSLRGSWVVVVALAVLGCARSVDVAGVWQGTWESADGASRGAFRVEVAQRGNRISGPITLEGAWVPEARVEGSVEGFQVRWGVVRGGVVVVAFEGTVEDGRASGVYRGPGGTGRWTARRVARR
jgi:hypothetical protein